MSNNFSTLKNRQSIDLNHLVRIECGKYVNDDLVLNAGKYEMPFNKVISVSKFNGSTVFSVFANGIPLTKVNSSPGSLEFSYDGTTFITGEIPSTTNIITIHFYLFFSDDIYRVIDQHSFLLNPITGGACQWEPRIGEIPDFTQSFQDIINGVLSIDSSNISLIMDDDGDLATYLGDTYSFFQKEIKVWAWINDLENIKEIFSGRIKGVRLNNEILELSISDILQALNSQALCTNKDLAKIPEPTILLPVDPSKVGQPIRLIFGSVSKHSYYKKATGSFLSSLYVEPQSLHEAFCINYTSTLGTSNNREYIAGRVRLNTNLVDSFTDFQCTPTSVDQSDPSLTKFVLSTTAQTQKFHVGDTFYYDPGTPPVLYFQIVYIDLINKTIYCNKDAAASVGGNIIKNQCPTIAIQDGDNKYYPVYQRDYTVGLSSYTYNGIEDENVYVFITFTNNFEANLGMPTLDPKTMYVGYRIKPNTTMNDHNDVLEWILKKAGLSCNAASFTQAFTDYPATVNFSIPSYDETDYSPFYKYVQDILKSTLGLITVEDDEVLYRIISVPSSTDEINNDNISGNKYNVDFNYQDIVTKIKAYNPNYNEGQQDFQATNTVENIKAKHLHGVINEIEFLHVLESIGTRLLDHLAVRSERFATYSFDTKNKNLDTILGDDFLIKKDRLPGNVTQKEVKVIGIQKGSDSVQLKCTDLLGF